MILLEVLADLVSVFAGAFGIWFGLRGLKREDRDQDAKEDGGNTEDEKD